MINSMVNEYIIGKKEEIIMEIGKMEELKVKVNLLI